MVYDIPIFIHSLIHALTLSLSRSFYPLHFQRLFGEGAFYYCLVIVALTLFVLPFHHLFAYELNENIRYVRTIRIYVLFINATFNETETSAKRKLIVHIIICCVARSLTTIEYKYEGKNETETLEIAR